MFEQDYIMRMIKDMVRMLLVFFTGKDIPGVYDTEEGLMEMLTQELKDYRLPMKERLQYMISTYDINKAENLLFEELDPKDPGDFMLAMWFFATLNALDDSALERCDYSREEITDGLKASADLYGIDPTLL